MKKMRSVIALSGLFIVLSSNEREDYGKIDIEKIYLLQITPRIMI